MDIVWAIADSDDVGASIEVSCAKQSVDAGFLVDSFAINFDHSNQAIIYPFQTDVVIEGDLGIGNVAQGIAELLGENLLECGAIVSSAKPETNFAGARADSLGFIGSVVTDDGIVAGVVELSECGVELFREVWSEVVSVDHFVVTIKNERTIAEDAEVGVFIVVGKDCLEALFATASCDGK